MQKTITIQGRVVPGRRLGRTLGFPTANVHLAADECRGRRMAGVWLARIVLEQTDGRYWALVNVGTRPTVEDAGRCKAEAWLLDFDGDLYGQRIAIELLEFLRPEKKFASVDELREAMERDRRNALNIIANDGYTL
ncbi:riboflavin kinase [Rikenella microfusus]|uniref:riboflavin kinase n=1 Tax=Rikenella microfusus TaxID=28139 RepID=UPI001D62A98E|nr:riboflavin kinase [Rikenella microfusus]HJE87578.1 riboflavin kinase [Rikenella microfusus]